MTHETITVHRRKGGPMDFNWNGLFHVWSDRLGNKYRLFLDDYDCGPWIGRGVVCDDGDVRWVTWERELKASHFTTTKGEWRWTQ